MKKADISKRDPNIVFRPLFSRRFVDIVNNIYYVVENNKSTVMSNFAKLNKNQKDFTKSLITRMATIKDFKSPSINHHLTGYQYGEITPWGHRFFFFSKLNNIIFFDYVEKKKYKLKDSVYKHLDEKKGKYEREFGKLL